MKKVLIIVSIALVFFSCNQESSSIKMSEKDMQSIDRKIDKNQLKGLYTYHENGDSIEFEITELGNQIVGKLSYSLAEKDKNTGTFKGTLNGNKLIGDYLFQSEGIESSRQVAFEIIGNKLIEGYGSMNEEGTAFKDTAKINYSSTMPLIKMN